MKILGRVLNTSEEERTFKNKDGKERTVRVVHVLLDLNDGICANCRGYDVPDFKLPKIGDKFEYPIKKYECFDGMLAQVLF